MRLESSTVKAHRALFASRLPEFLWVVQRFLPTELVCAC